jgi:hypothetical protein
MGFSFENLEKGLLYPQMTQIKSKRRIQGLNLRSSA